MTNISPWIPLAVLATLALVSLLARLRERPAAGYLYVALHTEPPPFDPEASYTGYARVRVPRTTERQQAVTFAAFTADGCSIDGFDLYDEAGRKVASNTAEWGRL